MRHARLQSQTRGKDLILRRSELPKDQLCSQHWWVVLTNGHEYIFYRLDDGSEWLWRGQYYSRVDDWSIVDDSTLTVSLEGVLKKYKIVRHGSQEGNRDKTECKGSRYCLHSAKWQAL